MVCESAEAKDQLHAALTEGEKASTELRVDPARASRRKPSETRPGKISRKVRARVRAEPVHGFLHEVLSKSSRRTCASVTRSPSTSTRRGWVWRGRGRTARGISGTRKANYCTEREGHRGNPRAISQVVPYPGMLGGAVASNRCLRQGCVLCTAAIQHLLLTHSGVES